MHSNKFTGTIPEDLRFSMIKFIDLGRNNFSGNLPEDIGEEWFELRYLYLDHNDFTGTIPKSYPTKVATCEILQLAHVMCAADLPSWPAEIVGDRHIWLPAEVGGRRRSMELDGDL